MTIREAIAELSGYGHGQSFVGVTFRESDDGIEAEWHVETHSRPRIRDAYAGTLDAAMLLYRERYLPELSADELATQSERLVAEAAHA